MKRRERRIRGNRERPIEEMARRGQYIERERVIRERRERGKKERGKEPRVKAEQATGNSGLFSIITTNTPDLLLRSAVFSANTLFAR
jgi:hypothetical protein